MSLPSNFQRRDKSTNSSVVNYPSDSEQNFLQITVCSSKTVEVLEINICLGIFIPCMYLTLGKVTKVNLRKLISTK